MKRQMPSTKELEREIKDRVKSMFRKDFDDATEEEIERIYAAKAEVFNTCPEAKPMPGAQFVSMAVVTVVTALLNMVIVTVLSIPVNKVMGNKEEE